MISGSGQQPRRIFFFIGLGLFVVGADCVCVCAGVPAAWRGCSVVSRSHSPAVCLSLFFCVYAVHLPVSLPPMLRALVVPARCRPDRSLHREQQAKSTKAQVTMMLRRVLCVLLFALCCACVCATAQEEGQYDAAVFKAAGGDPKKNTTNTTTTTTTTTSKAPKNTTTTTSKAPTPEDARSPGGPVWVQVSLLLLLSAAVATAGAAC
ncbi:hypothetical protein ECC02_013903 [Trypanosoma cruzi]|uniref:Uncharacterized protein n=1 Tax=Trypanosoma cruzi TaxID=5693 RepID=A0A7J6XFY9_TRYCR|nr:hypothetical protein ECC02_013903 [Trypanosoma cruzi]